MPRQSNYARLVMAAIFSTLLLLTGWFLLAARPELTRLSGSDPYRACNRLMALLDHAQGITLGVALALALPHLALTVQRALSDHRPWLSRWMIGDQFSLGREVLLDVWLCGMAVLIIGLIEGVQTLFDCELLLAGA